AVGVADQRDEGGAVRIIFEPLDRRRRVILAPLEIDDAVAPFVPATAPAHGDAAGIVAPALLLQTLGQRLDRLSLPQLAAVDGDVVPLRRGGRIVCLERHALDPVPQTPVVTSIRDPSASVTIAFL